MTCVEELTCNFTSPMDVFSFYQYQYGIPDAAVLGLFLGILIAAIYLWTRSLNILVILGVYAISATTAFAAEDAIAPGYQGVVWIIALAVASIVVIMLLKITRE